MQIALVTLNAKYIHASLGLRCLRANLGEFRAQSVICEFVISQRPLEIAEQILALKPRIIGFGVYIWNVQETLSVVRLLKLLAPETKIVLGGPEVSYESAQQDIVQAADYVITGWGDISFAKLCKALLDGPKPLMKIIPGEQPSLDELEFPYAEYTDRDLSERLLYVEASRGCPFKCEFCLSSLDKTAWPFDQALFLLELTRLYERGARNFKFVDRTFNLKIDASVKVLEFFLERMSPELFIHFEVIPDHLPDRLKALIAKFPAGCLQFEVGVQSFTPQVQARISRRADNAKTIENIRWLCTQSHAHVHADLIFGLPGETLESFAASFNALYAAGPHEIQFGILKRLRGTPIIRHTQEFDLRFDPEPPYAILQTSTVGFSDMQRINRFARYWDVVANSGRYSQAAKLIAGALPFERFLAFADWLYAQTGKTHEFAQERVIELLLRYLTEQLQQDAQQVGQALAADFLASGARGAPRVIEAYLPQGRELQAHQARLSKQRAERQARHAIAQAAAAA